MERSAQKVFKINNLYKLTFIKICTDFYQLEFLHLYVLKWYILGSKKIIIKGGVYEKNSFLDIGVSAA